MDKERFMKIEAIERKKRSLEDILNGPDSFGLLNVVAKRKNSSGGSSVSGLTAFDEVNNFIDSNNRQPNTESQDFSERLLAHRYNGYVNNPDRHKHLTPFDRHGLLSKNPQIAVHTDKQIGTNSMAGMPAIKRTTTEIPKTATKIEEGNSNPVRAEKKPKEASSLADIFNNPLFAELSKGSKNLYDMSGLTSSTESKNKADMIGQQKPCNDFYKYEDAFIDQQSKLKSGESKTTRFSNESQVREGDFFILEGVLCFVEKVGKYRVDNQGRYDPRLKIILENRTESNILLRTFSKRLYTDRTGRRVIRDAESVVDDFNNTARKPIRTGQIYIVRTKSNNAALKAVPNLLKIGFTTSTVEERTKNCINDTAFLEAPIEVMARADCYDINPHGLESLIHAFLYAQRVQVTLTSKKGRKYHPQEWFSVRLEDAKEIIKRIVDKSIVEYRMDNTTNRMVKKIIT